MGVRAYEAVLECVVNLSEGRDRRVVEQLAAAGGSCLLDVHSDAYHHRSVLTLGGPDADVERAAREVARVGVRLIDITVHSGAHPRLGAVDVVPFVPLAGRPLAGRPLAAALAARDRFAAWAADELAVPCFLYGPERSLPEVRRRAFTSLAPDTGPAAPHPTAGAACVGARSVLVAYNLWLAPGTSLDDARRVATDLRGPAVRALALALGDRVQVSLNLIEPLRFGPADAYDTVAAAAPVERAELVGLLPAEALGTIPARRWPELDLAADRTIEARLGACSG